MLPLSYLSMILSSLLQEIKLTNNTIKNIKCLFINYAFLLPLENLLHKCPVMRSLQLRIFSNLVLFLEALGHLAAGVYEVAKQTDFCLLLLFYSSLHYGRISFRV